MGAMICRVRYTCNQNPLHSLTFGMPISGYASSTSLTARIDSFSLSEFLVDTDFMEGVMLSASREPDGMPRPDGIADLRVIVALPSLRSCRVVQCQASDSTR